MLNQRRRARPSTDCGKKIGRTDATDLAKGVEAISPPGEQLVGVGLVPGVPHDPVAR
jgi:hypothetical protein